MGKVVVELSMSLDGYVAGPHDGPDRPLGDGGEALFEWYRSGDTPLALPGTGMVFQVSRTSAELLRAEWAAGGASVTGRRTFDIANAWQGQPPGIGQCFVVSHTVAEQWSQPGSRFRFVADGVASAVRQAQAAAGDREVSVSSASVVQQCLQLGLLDEIRIDLVPVLLGGGVSLFGQLGTAPVRLERIAVVAAPGVTHLRFRVIR